MISGLILYELVSPVGFAVFPSRTEVYIQSLSIFNFVNSRSLQKGKTLKKYGCIGA